MNNQARTVPSFVSESNFDGTANMSELFGANKNMNSTDEAITPIQILMDNQGSLDSPRSPESNEK